MSSKRHGTAQQSIPHVPRGEFAFEERTVQDIATSARIARAEGLIPSITARESARAKGSTPPPNVIPFTKPRAIAALAASDPDAVVIEDSTTRFRAADVTSARQAGPAKSSSTADLDRTATRVATGWQPPADALPTPLRSRSNQQPMVPRGVQTLYPAAPVSGPVTTARDTVLPVPSLHTVPRSAPVLDLPAIVPAPARGAAPARTVAPAPVPTSAPAPAPPPAAAPSAWPLAAATIAPAPSAFVPSTPAPSTPAPSTPAPDATTPGFSAFEVAPTELAGSPLAEPRNRWAVFEKIGLGAPKAILKNPQKLIVNAYRLLGFAILSIIVFVLVGYLANTAFFYLSSSWVVPMAVAPTDEKVVALQSQLAEQQNTRDRIADDLNQAERQIAAQQAFQLEFAKAIKSDLEGRKAALGRVRELANTAAATRRAIKRQNSAYANASRRRMKREYAAGLIDRNAMLSGKFQLAQITSSNLSLAERQAEFETRAAELESETRSLDAILADVDNTNIALSYEVLRIKQEYAASRLDLAKSVETRNTLKASLVRQDKIVGALKQSAYLRAVTDNASVAFVPYGNLENAEQGSSVYACHLGMVFCYHVGEVLEVLPGEVQFKHPHRDRMLRGQMVEIQLDEDEADAAAGDVLYVGGKPLLF